MFEVSAEHQPMRPVENPMTIMIGELTVVQTVPLHARPDKFPQWTYRLTPILNLPEPTNPPTQFIDVMGAIRGISNVATLALPGRNVLAARRHVLIDDGSGNEVRITLWGESAFRLNGPGVRALSEDQPAAVVFVGLTVTMVKGLKELSGSTACRWYINDDSEESNVFQTSLMSTFRPITHLLPPRQMTLRAASDFAQPIQKLSALLNSDDLHHLPSRFRCLVRIWRLTPGERWWFISCIDCGRNATQVPPAPGQPGRFTCSRVGCGCTEATLEYRLNLLGCNSTGEAEFTLYGRLAQNIVGVSAKQLISNNLRADADRTNLAAAAATITHTPPELAAVVDWTYQLVIYVTAGCFQRGWAKFYVGAVEDAYPPE